MKTKTVKMSTLQLPTLYKGYFLSDSFKISSVYYTHHDTFLNFFDVFFLDLKKTEMSPRWEESLFMKSQDMLMTSIDKTMIYITW